MLDIANDSSGIPRAFLRIGGSTVAQQQLKIALDLGCERIVCLAPSLTPEMVTMQHRAERAGAQFHVAGGARPLLGLVSAADEVIAFSDGLFASGEQAVAILGSHPAILVQPVEQGLANGFERIDINHAAAGAMRIPGHLVERLGDLPADCDVVSSLQRIALQAGVHQRLINPGQPDGGFWSMVRNETEAHELEPRWVYRQTSDDRPAGPTRVLATALVRRFGPALLHAGTGSGAMIIAAIVVLMLAVGAGMLGFAAVGCGVSAAGWLLVESAAVLGRVEHQGNIAQRRQTALSMLAWAFDGALVFLLGLAGQHAHSMPEIERFFPALMLVALSRILDGVYQGRSASWFSDRGIMAFVFMGFAAVQQANLLAHVGAVVAALAVLAGMEAKSRLTSP